MQQLIRLVKGILGTCILALMSIRPTAVVAHTPIQNKKSLWGAKEITIQRAQMLPDITVLELPTGEAHLTKIEMVYVVSSFPKQKLPDRRSVCLTYQIGGSEFKIIEARVLPGISTDDNVTPVISYGYFFNNNYLIKKMKIGCYFLKGRSQNVDYAFVYSGISIQQAQNLAKKLTRINAVALRRHFNNTNRKRKHKSDK